MSDLVRIFDQEMEANYVATSAESRRVLADAVVGRSRRAARVRAWNTAALTAIAVLVAGTGMWQLGGAVNQPAHVNPSPTPSPTPSSTTDGPPEIQAGDWEVDWNGDATDLIDVDPYEPTAIQAPDAFDDGLDHADLPPLVERPGLRYPVAHELEDWVWDQVGPGWGLATYGLGGSSGRAGLGDEVSRLYLVSSEGIHFEMRELSHDGNDANQSWHVEDWSVTGGWVALSGGNYETDGYWVDVQDLRTGTVLASDSGGEGVSQGDGLSITTGLNDGLQLWLEQPFAPSDADVYVSDYSPPSLTAHSPDGTTTPITISGWSSGAVSMAEPSDDGRYVALIAHPDDGPAAPAWVFDAVEQTLTAVEFPALEESQSCSGPWFTTGPTVVVGTSCRQDDVDQDSGLEFVAGESSATWVEIGDLTSMPLEFVGNDEERLEQIVDPVADRELSTDVVAALGGEANVGWIEGHEFAPDRIAISRRNGGLTVLYDRASGDWYPLTTPFMRDSTYATGLTGFAVLGTEDGT